MARKAMIRSNGRPPQDRIGSRAGVPAADDQSSNLSQTRTISDRQQRQDHRIRQDKEGAYGKHWIRSEPSP